MARQYNTHTWSPGEFITADKVNRIETGVNSVMNFTKDIIKVAPEDYGAVGDGSNDDSEALYQAIQEINTNGGSLWLGCGKTYMVKITESNSHKLTIYKRCNVYGNGSTIRVIPKDTNDANDLRHSGPVLSIVHWYQNQFPESQGKALITNLTIDCNGEAPIGLDIKYSLGIELQNLDICYFTQIGINCYGGFEILADNIRLAGSNTLQYYADGNAVKDTIGLYQGWGLQDPSDSTSTSNAGDSRFSNVITKNVGIAVHNGTGNNFYTHIHAWNTNSYVIPYSVMFDTKDDIRAIDCCLDTVMYGFKIHNHTHAIYINDFTIICPSIYMSDQILGAGNRPIVFMFSFDNTTGLTAEQILARKKAATERIKAYGMHYFNPDQVYKLFDYDTRAYHFDFDWVENNDSSITAMEYVPRKPISAKTINEVIKKSIALEALSEYVVWPTNIINTYDETAFSANTNMDKYGVITSVSGRWVSDYFYIKPDTEYSININSILCFYDCNKNYISGVELWADAIEGQNYVSFTTPEEAFYVRGCSSVWYDGWKVNEGVGIAASEAQEYHKPYLDLSSFFPQSSAEEVEESSEEGGN